MNIPLDTLRRLYETERQLPNRNYAHGHSFEAWLVHEGYQM